MKHIGDNHNERERESDICHRGKIVSLVFVRSVQLIIENFLPLNLLCKYSVVLRLYDRIT